jgi:hypothetical protein
VSDYEAQRLAASEAKDRVTLEQIGARIGYGNAMHILGLKWYALLNDRYGITDDEATQWRGYLRRTIAECQRLLKGGDHA